MVKQLIQAHAYWRLKGLSVDLVIWNEDSADTGRYFKMKLTPLVPVN